MNDDDDILQVLRNELNRRRRLVGDEMWAFHDRQLNRARRKMVGGASTNIIERAKEKGVKLDAKDEKIRELEAKLEKMAAEGEGKKPKSIEPAEPLDKEVSEEEIKKAKQALRELPSEEDIPSKGAMIRRIAQGPLKRAVDNIIRRAFQLIRIGGSVGGFAITGSFGDNLVELILLLLPAAKLGVDVGILAATSTYAAELVSIDFEGGLANVEKELETIMTKIRKDPDGSRVIRDLCVQFKSVIETIAVSFGQIISIFMPVDFALTGIFVEELIISASSDSYLLLKLFYLELPDFVTQLLESKENLTDFINAILDLMIEQQDDTYLQRIGRGGMRSAIISAVTGAGILGTLLVGIILLPLFPVFLAISVGIGFSGAAVQGGNLLFTAGVGDEELARLINEKLRPRIPELVQMISTTLALGFISLKILEEC